MGYNKAKKKLSKKNRQTKSVLVFDEKARKDYLTGFKKRKDERRKKAQEQVEKMIKEDRKLLRQKTREFDQVKTKSQRLQPDMEELARKQVTELPEHTVTITDISEIDLAGHAGTRLGLNQIEDDSDGEEDVEGSEETTDKPEISVHKHDRAVKNIKHKIEKTSKHLKKKKSNKFKPKRMLSKKKKQQKKRSKQNY